MATSAASEPAPGEPRSYLTFVLGEEEYGVPLGRVIEIAPNEGCTALPGAPALLRGVVPVHGVPVAVVDLARKFGLPARADAIRESLVVVEAEVLGVRRLLAVTADRIGRVLEALPGAVERVPLLSSGIRAEFLEGMVRKDPGFVLLLDLDRALSATEQEALGGELARLEADSEAPSEAAAPAAPASNAEEALPKVLCRLVIATASGLRCAVDASRVREVTVGGAVTAVPGSPSSFHGLFNLRGAVLPVLDLGAAMGRARLASRTRSAFLVVDAPGDELGAAALAVDAVLGLAEVATGEIAELPGFAAPTGEGLASGTAVIGDGPVVIVDLAALLADRGGAAA